VKWVMGIAHLAKGLGRLGVALACLVSGAGLAHAGPPAPVDPALGFWRFEDTNTWYSSFGYAPMAFTNIVGVPAWNPLGNAMWLDDSGEPSYLWYHGVESDGHSNLCFSAGTLWLFFAPDWASVDQGGTGPETWARLFEAGAYTTNASYGWWSVYLNPEGTNLFFSTQTNGAGATYAAGTVSFASNSWNLIALTYSTTNTSLFFNGQLVSSGPGVSLWPSADVLTNGLFIGSDSTGLLQARGLFTGVRTFNDAIYYSPEYFTNWWSFMSNLIANWQGSGGGGGGDFAPGGFVGPGSPASGCNTNGPARFTNFVATVVPNAGVTVTFTIAGGTNGTFDAFTTASLAASAPFSPQWTWLGQVITCDTYQLTNQPVPESFYLLALPGTVGGIPVAWLLEHGLNPSDPSVATENPASDGLTNLQKYLYGADPEVSTGFGVWVASPSGVSGIP
jgi:hypothetical protein